MFLFFLRMGRSDAITLFCVSPLLLSRPQNKKCNKYLKSFCCKKKKKNQKVSIKIELAKMKCIIALKN